MPVGSNDFIKAQIKHMMRLERIETKVKRAIRKLRMLSNQVLWFSPENVSEVSEDVLTNCQNFVEAYQNLER